MRKKHSNFTIKKKVIIITTILSLLLYVAGVFSGLYVSKVIEKRTETQILTFKTETKTDLNSLKNIVDLSVLDLKNIILQQLFIDNFKTENKCEFTDLYISNLYKQLGAFWNVMPLRLEEYDKKTQATAEYISIKREYIRFSLRFWLVSDKNFQECKNKNFVPVLYFYTKNCENCIEQGLEFDKLSESLKKFNQTLIVFPIDAEFEDDTVFLLKQYYNITAYPFIIINNFTSQGELLTSIDLERNLNMLK